jgi:hypothetical protein
VSISAALRRTAVLTVFAVLAAPAANATRIYIDFGDGNFDASGNFFPLAGSHDVDVDPDLSAGPIGIGFDIDFGAGPVNSLYLNENGLVSFGAALGNTFTPVASLADLGVPVIAPYYSDLVGAPLDGDDASIVQGQVFYSLGEADPFPDGANQYSLAETVPAFRATWYGVTSASDPTAQVYAQLYLYSLGGGDFDMRFAYGNPDISGGGVTPSLDALAGFALGGTAAATATAPFSLATDYVFSFRGGQLVDSPPPTTDVPEPPAIVLTAAGLALMTLILQRRRRRG